MHFKWVNCMVCEFYLDKAVKKRKKKQVGEFPGATITKHHKLGALEQETFIVSLIWGQKSKIKVWAGP